MICYEIKHFSSSFDLVSYDYGNPNAMSPENPYAPGTPSRGKARPSQPPPAPPSTGNDHYYHTQGMLYQSKPIKKRSIFFRFICVFPCAVCFNPFLFCLSYLVLFCIHWPTIQMEMFCFPLRMMSIASRFVIVIYCTYRSIGMISLFSFFSRMRAVFIKKTSFSPITNFLFTISPTNKQATHQMHPMPTHQHEIEIYNKAATRYHHHRPCQWKICMRRHHLTCTPWPMAMHRWPPKS